MLWDQNSLNNLRSQCVQLAQYFKSRGIKVKYWELWNEADIQGATGSGGTFTSAAVVGQTTAVVYPALAAVDSTYLFGQSPNAVPRGKASASGGDLLTGGADFNDTTYLNASLSAYPQLYYDAGHAYFTGGDQGLQNGRFVRRL